MPRAYRYECAVTDPATHEVTSAVYAAASRTLVGNIGSSASLGQPQGLIREEPSLVIVTCDKGHVCEYQTPDDALQSGPVQPNPTVRTGRLLSAKELAAWEALVDHAAPVKSVERSITYAKWLFGGTTTVALLAAGLATTGAPDLDARQRVVFFIAELLLAIAMIAAAFCMAPKWVRYNPTSPDSLDAAFSRALATQRICLQVGAFFFGLALAAASFVPVSRIHPASAPAAAAVHRLSVALTGDGGLDVKVVASHLPANTVLEAGIHGLAPRTADARRDVDSIPLAAPFARAYADSAGNAELALSVPPILWAYDSLRVVAIAKTPDGTVLHREEVGIGVQRLGVKKS